MTSTNWLSVKVRCERTSLLPSVGWRNAMKRGDMKCRVAYSWSISCFSRLYRGGGRYL